MAHWRRHAAGGYPVTDYRMQTGVRRRGGPRGTRSLADFLASSLAKFSSAELRPEGGLRPLGRGLAAEAATVAAGPGPLLYVFPLCASFLYGFLLD